MRNEETDPTYSAEIYGIVSYEGDGYYRADAYDIGTQERTQYDFLETKSNFEHPGYAEKWLRSVAKKKLMNMLSDDVRYPGEQDE
jgi:hypothetical protein